MLINMGSIYCQTAAKRPGSNSMITPYPHQRQAIDSLYNWFAANQEGNPLLVLPTGAGKSVVLAVMIREILQSWPDQRILVLTHVKELIEQNAKRLAAVWPEAPMGIHSAGLRRRDCFDPIIFAGIQSVHSKALHLGRFDLILVDECHLISGKASSMYQQFFAASRQINPVIRIVGLTATDFRTGTGSLTHGHDALFAAVAYQIDLLYLIEQGFLCPLVSRPVDTQIDVTGVQTQNGEFVAGQLESAADKDEITQAALSEAIALGADRQHWLVFCAGVNHAYHVTAALNARGVKAACVTGETPALARANAIAEYRAGRLRALVTVGVLTTGFDAPETDLLVMLRPTQSPGLYVQISGRGMRTAPGKTDCMVLDFAGNALRHGPVDQVKAWIPKPKTGPTAAPFKICPECESKVATSTRVCYCGYEFDLSEKPKHDAHATTAPMLSTDIRAATVRKPVSRVIYCKHQSIGKMPSLRVDYYDGLMKAASEWVCLQHDGYARRKAVQWWVQRRNDPALPVPDSIDEALDAMPYDNLKRPSAIVIVQKKYPEIVGYEFE